MQAQFCLPVSTLIRTPLASFAIITHSFNDRNLILRKTDGEYAKRGREAEGCTLIFRFCVKPGVNTQNGSVKPRGAALIFRFCVKPRANTQNGGREAEGRRLNISFLRKTDGEYAKRGREVEGSRLNISFLRKTESEYAKRGRAMGCSFRCEKVESVVSF